MSKAKGFAPPQDDEEGDEQTDDIEKLGLQQKLHFFEE